MRLVNGEVLSEVDLTYLRNKDDRVMILGGLVEVEANENIVIDNPANFFPEMSIADTEILEGDRGRSFAEFPVTLNSPSDKIITVNFTTADGTATVADGDYELTNGRLIFPRGETERMIRVPVIGDTKVEPDETFRVILSDPQNVTLANAVATGTIINDDIAQISISDTQILEGDRGRSFAEFKVTLDRPSNQMVRVNFTTADGTATVADEDYQETSGQLVFPRGQTERVIRVPVIGDTKLEPDETFKVILSEPENAELGRDEAIGTILNDDVPEMSIADTEILEGDRGRSFAEFKVTLNSPSDQMITVNFTTADGTATVADGDYQPTNGRLVFPRGQTERVIRVPVIGDTKIEPDETFRVILSDPQNVTLANRQATGTILNDDIAQISISDTQILEGDRGRSFAEFKVTLDRPSNQMVRVNFTTADDTATVADEDYEPTSGQLVFPRGQTERVIRVPVIGDTKVEPDETFKVILSEPENAELGRDEAIGTILNDDDDDIIVPEMSIADTEILEGDRGRSFAEFPVTLNSPSDKIITVNFTTADGTATVADRDYERTTGRLVFPRGETERVIRVPVFGDTKVEPDETFRVILSEPQNAELGRGQATGTILNDDIAQISISDTQILEGDRGRSFAEFKVTLDRPSNQMVRVNFTTADDTATVADEDYEETSGQLVFPRGQTERVIRVPVIGDTKVEPDETFKVILSEPENAELGRDEAIGTILNDDDDDIIVPEMSIADTEILEGDRGRSFAEFKVTLNRPSDQIVRVNFTTGDGTATVADSDYERTRGELVFPRGQTERVIRVPVIGDTKVEPDETFRVILSNPQNVTLANRQATGTILNDDVPEISIADTQILEGDRGRSFAEFKVTLDRPSNQMVRVNFTTADGTATVADEDYEPTSGQLVFPRGQTERVIRVPVIGDTKVEPDETFKVILSEPENAELGRDEAIGTILNDDIIVPEMSIADTEILEGDRGRSFAEFKVTLNRPSDQIVRVNFTTGDGTATVADSDYERTRGELVFRRGQTERVIRVPVIGDTKVEPDETFRVILSNPQNVTLANRQATGTILNDDVPEISIADSPPIEEGDRGRSFAEFKVTLNSPSNQIVRVNYATADGTATVADGDYEPTSGELVFARGQTERVIRVPVIGDTEVEPDETFKVILSEPENADLGRDQATGTILNDDGLVSANISIADTQILEGDRGRSFAEFKVTLDSPSDQIVRVNYTTADGTAKVADRDYELTRGELIFPRGETERVIRVPVIGDTKRELDETFKVILSDPQNAELERGEAIGTILDDDDPERGSWDNPFVLGNLTGEIVRTNRIGFIESGKRDVNDYYRFRLNRTGTVTINLDDLVANANLQLLGSQGELIDQSNNPGTQAETIMQRDLEPGIYHVRVHPHVSARTKYRLSIELI
ncbi:pre-peptidase C-terminal domain-containing protein [Limnospira indica PCC 9438]|nr:pre-peptidase C-terminal domain-containing protein [Arthrospira platensis C1]